MSAGSAHGQGMWFYDKVRAASDTASFRSRSHLSLRGRSAECDISTPSSTKRLAHKTFGRSSCLFLCLRLKVYDYHRLIGFLERLERREEKVNRRFLFLIQPKFPQT